MGPGVTDPGLECNHRGTGPCATARKNKSLDNGRMSRSLDVLRKVLPYTTVAVVVAGCYSGWIIYSRSKDQRDAERAAQAVRIRTDREIVEKYGSGNVKIMAFYASPPALAAGQKGLLCYGVANAKTVRIDPIAEPVTPSLSRCLEIQPRKDTKYTLTAQDASGNHAAQAVEVRVRP